MKIKRGGKEIVLSYPERLAIHREVEHEFNVDEAKFMRFSFGLDVTDEQFEILVREYEHAKRHCELYEDADEMCFQAAIDTLREEGVI